MAGQDMTYDDVLVALDDIVAAETPVQVFIGGQTGTLVAGLGGSLHRVAGPFLDELRPVYVAHGGGDADLAAFFVHGGQEHGRLPCFVICRALFETATAVTQDELAESATAGMFWRALTVFNGGVAINIGVESIGEVG